MLSARDLITVGIFSAIYFVLTYASGMAGFAGPQFMFLGFFIGILLNSMVMALYAARLPKFGAFTAVALINGIVFTLTGHAVWTLLGAILCGLLADLVLKGTSSINLRFPIAYGIFSMWYAFPLLPIVYSSEAYFADVESQMGAEYANAMAHVFQPWTIGAVALMAFIVGAITALFGLRVSRRHFESAGLI